MTLTDTALVTEAGPVAAVESTFRVYSGFGVGEYTTMLPAVGPQGEVDETDTVRPSVIAQYPAHFSTDLPKQTDVVFQLTFSEPIVLHPGAYVQVHYRGDKLAFNKLADNVTVDRLVVHNDVLQFTSYLAADSYYDVRITPDMVRDRVGNSHRGLKAGAYVVRTASYKEDSAPPALVASTPPMTFDLGPATTDFVQALVPPVQPTMTGCTLYFSETIAASRDFLQLQSELGGPADRLELAV